MTGSDDSQLQLHELSRNSLGDKTSLHHHIICLYVPGLQLLSAGLSRSFGRGDMKVALCLCHQLCIPTGMSHSEAATHLG